MLESLGCKSGNHHVRLFQAIKFRSSSSQTTFLDRNIVQTLNVAPSKIPSSSAGPTATANGDAADASGFAALALSSATAGAAPAAPGDRAGDGGGDKSPSAAARLATASVKRPKSSGSSHSATKRASFNGNLPQGMRGTGLGH